MTLGKPLTANTSARSFRSTFVPQHLAWLWAICVTVVLIWLFRDRGFDDPFITYRYAENLAHGNGFVYNIGERVLSTTTPFYTMLLAITHIFGLNVPVASNVISCASIALGGLALWKLGQTWQTPIAGTAALLLYPAFPLLIPTMGAETSLYVALIALGILAYARQNYYGTAVLLAAAMLTRADGILAALVVTAHFLLVRRGPIPWRAVGLFCLLTAPWFMFAWSYFGAPVPVTLAAKQRQGSMTISTNFWRGLGLLLRDYWYVRPFRLHAGLAVVGLVYAIMHKRQWLLILAWNAVYIAAYSFLGVSNYFWYYGPLVVGIIALVALGIEGCWQTLMHRLPQLLAAIVAVGLIVAALLGQIWQVNRMTAAPDSRLAIYSEVGQWLKQNTPAEASVGTLEVGIIGYHAQRRMIDFAGLIQPAVAQQMQASTTYGDTAFWAVEQYRPEYLVLHAGMFTRIENDPQVQAHCEVVQTFQRPEYNSPLNVHQCRW